MLVKARVKASLLNCSFLKMFRNENAVDIVFQSAFCCYSKQKLIIETFVCVIFFL